MTPANSGLTAILCGVLIGIVGCGQSETAGPLMSDNDALLNELLGSAEPDPSDPAEVEAGDEADSSIKTVSSGSEVQSTENDTSESIVDDILGSRTSATDSVTTTLVGNSTLTPFANSAGANVASANTSFSQTGQMLQLRSGDQFPFVKTVRQTVVQATTNSARGTSDQTNAQTLMQLTINLSVLNSTPNGYVVQVRYDRVQYSQDVNGQRQVFDSATGPGNGATSNAVPAGIEAYVGMVGSGFRFTLSAENKVVGTDGLSQFLDQCVSAVPFEQRVTSRAALEQRFQFGAVAELVDESIGLLPFGTSVPRTGDIWVTDRKLQQQSPIQMQTTCRLLSTSATVAEIGLTGRIESSANQAAFTISDGRTMGTCLVDLVTGMPVHSHRSSYLKISSQQSVEQLVEISKRIESTFTSQSESARLIVQQYPSNSSPLSGTSSAIGSAVRMSSPHSQPVQSAMLPGSSGAGFGASPSQNPGQPLQVQPVSSANPINRLGGTAPLQIPGGVSSEDLQSTAEAVYPD